MKRKLLIALLAFGTVGGFGSGIASMACFHHHAAERRAAFERHVADVCVEAAHRAQDGQAPVDRPPPPQGHGMHHPHW